MDIRPVRRPMPPQAQPPMPPVTQPDIPPIAPSTPPLPIDTPQKTKRIRKRKKWLIILATILSLGIVAAATAWVLYQVQLTPVDASNKDKVEVEIVQGSSPKAIASTLKQANVIKHSAFTPASTECKTVFKAEYTDCLHLNRRLK
jgi:hypothetical protein